MKKEFYKKYKELHWVNFNDDIENPVVRQLFMKLY